MSKSIKNFLVLLLVLQLVIPYSAFAAAIGQFSAITGNVTQSREKMTYRGAVKAPLEVKDIILTSDNSSATMIFSDESTIKLESNSTLVIKDYSLDREKSRKSAFTLSTGKLTANVKKFIGDDNTFQVYTPTAVAEVKGTIFIVTIETIANVPTTIVTCLEGSMSINYLTTTGVTIPTTTLAAGKRAVITAYNITVTDAVPTAVAATTSGEAGAPTKIAAATEAGTTSGKDATAGMSTGTIAKYAVITAIVIGVVAAAAGGGGGGSSSNHP